MASEKPPNIQKQKAAYPPQADSGFAEAYRPQADSRSASGVLLIAPCGAHGAIDNSPRNIIIYNNLYYYFVFNGVFLLLLRLLCQ